MSSIYRGFISIFSGKVVSLLLGLLITPIIVRALGSSLYGDYAFILSILGISTIITDTGIFDGVRKYMTETRDDIHWKEHVFAFYSRIAIVLALCAGVCYSLLAWAKVPSSVFGDGFDIYFMLLAVLIVVRQAYSLSRGGLMGLYLEKYSELLSILKKSLFGLFAILLFAMGNNIVDLLIAHIVAGGAVAVVSVMLILRKLNPGELIRSVPTNLPKREMLSFNTWSVVLILLTASLYHVDILLLRSISGSQQTGYYRAALVIAEFLWFVPNSLQTALLHSSSELWSENKTDKITHLVARVTRYNLSLTVLLGLGLSVLASDFLPLYYGAEFEAAVQPLLILLPGTLGFALARPIFAVGQGKGDLRKLIGATGTAAVLNLALNLLLIPYYGMAGAAAATSLSYGSMLLLHIISARSIGFDPIADVRVVRVAGAAAVTTAVIFPLSMLIRSGIVSLLTVPPTGFVVYALSSIALGVVTRGELRTLVDRLPIPVARYV